MPLPVASGNEVGGSTASQVQIPCIVFFVITPIFVLIRVWSRTRVRGRIGSDDWTMLASFIFSLAVSSLTYSNVPPVMASCYYGFGQHISKLSSDNKMMTLKLFYAAQAFYKLTMNLTKSSILLLYLRIFIQRPFRIICYVLLAIILSYMLATFFASIFQCTPVSRAWDRAIPGTCISIPKNWYANAGFSIVTDLIILVLPMPILYRSRIPLNQKAALMLVFMLGVFGTLTSIFRMQTLNLSSTSPDSTYEVASSRWTIIEENVGLICSCLPICKPLLSLLFPTIFPPASKDSSNATGGIAGTGYVHRGAGKNDWTPSTGGNDALGISLGTVTARREGGGSEESILQHELVLERGQVARGAVVVRKDTDFNVSFRE